MAVSLKAYALSQPQVGSAGAVAPAAPVASQKLVPGLEPVTKTRLDPSGEKEGMKATSELMLLFATGMPLPVW